MKRLRLLRLQARPMAAALLAIASASAFADNQSSAGNKSGVMVFPNVNVVSAPATATTAPSAGAAGMRAQKDQDTGQLRAPTREEMAELEAQAPATTEAEAAVQVRQLANGGKVAILNEAYMSYSIVSKDASGKLTEQCLTGESAADHALHNAPAAEEVRHER